MNYRKSSAKVFTLILMAVSIIAVSAVNQDAFAQNIGMSISATADQGSSTITISGQTASTLSDITIVVIAPNGNIVSVDQISPDANGGYMAEIQVSDKLWKQDGAYTIKAQQSNSVWYTLSVQVSIVDGTTMLTDVSESTFEFEGVTVPEFGSGIMEEQGLSIEADAVQGSTTIGISGHTARQIGDITIVVTAPNGNIVSVDQISPDANGDFMVDIQTGSNLWSQDGDYTITAQQGSASLYKQSVVVEIADGAVIPEFGAITAMILAVSIIAIIAVSARSRLGIMPKY